jgi:hypothetical protein
MPPHCETLDGPVVAAAREALTADDVDRAPPYVPVDGEDEVRAAFDLARKARGAGGARSPTSTSSTRWCVSTVGARERRTPA